MALHRFVDYLHQITSPRVQDEFEHPPRAEHIGFPGGEPRYRTMRLRAALACRRYNDLAEDAKPEDREAAFRAIFPGYGIQNPPVQSHASDPSVTPGPSVLPHGTHEAACIDTAATTLPTAPSPSQVSNHAEPIASLAPTITHSDHPQHENNYAGYGKCPYIKAPLWVDYGTNVHIDGTTFINRNCTILDTPISRLDIGKQCSVGPGVSFYCVTHPLDPDERHNPNSMTSSIAADISIGDYVWLGGGVIVLPGVSIGEGCVIGAGSVVTKSMPPYVLAHGVPARIRRCIKRSADGSVDKADRDRAIKSATVRANTSLPTAGSRLRSVKSPINQGLAIEGSDPSGTYDCPKFAMVMQRINFLERIITGLAVIILVLVLSLALVFTMRLNVLHGISIAQ